MNRGVARPLLHDLALGRRVLSEKPADWEMENRRNDIEPKNWTGVMAVRRLAHLPQAYVRIDVLRTASETDLKLGRRGNRARVIIAACARGGRY